mgnify:CR=1 FL=1|tara:strand:+ start:3951 stop:5894 length:1944 start_codon:yes stop_codon:yes gene_type:complete
MKKEQPSNNEAKKEFEELKELIIGQNKGTDVQKKAEYLVKKYPDHVKIKQTLASIYLNNGKLEQSKEILEDIIKIKKDNEYTHYFLLINHARNNNYTKLVGSFFQALRINKNFKEIYKVFFNHLNTFKINDYSLLQNNEAKNITLYALENNFIPINDIKLIIQETLLADLRILKNDISISELDRFLSSYLKKKNENLILYLLENTTNTNSLLEKNLILIRNIILKNLDNFKEKNYITSIIAAMFCQSYLNGHIWYIDKESSSFLENLINNNIKKIENNEKLNYIELLVIGVYINLDETPKLKKYLIENLKKQNNQIYNKVILFLNRLSEDKKLSGQIKKIHPINNNLSKDVKKFYDKNYCLPWDYISTEGEINFLDYLKINIRPIDLLGTKRFPDNPKILYIGCGSGREALKLNTLKNSEIDIIDISIENLLYTQRKIDELGIKNINLYNLDLLNIEKLDKNYDVIVADKVLSQVEDFEYSLNIILDKLNSEGFMKVILKSPISNEIEEKIRNKINSLKQYEENDIRSLQKIRKNILESDDENHKKLRSMPIFYNNRSLNKFMKPMYKKLIDIKEIKNLINSNKLEFIGWADFIVNRTLKEAIMDLYTKNYENDYLKKNLNNWDDFERKNPIIFSDMYKFWVRKKKI